MATPVPIARIEQLRRMGICKEASLWFTEPRTYEQLVTEHPEWVVVAARQSGADVATLERVTIELGSAALRRSFAQHVRGADVDALLRNIE